MGFFSSCFACSKDQNQRKGCKRVTSRNKVNHDDQPCQINSSPQKSILKNETLVSNSEPRENNEQVKCSVSSKKVTFDLNVKKYETTADSYEYEETSEQEEELSDKCYGSDNEDEDKKEKVNPVSKYRYENCESSDDEGLDYEFVDDIALKDFGKEADVFSIGGESYDSFFSLPTENEKQRGKTEAVAKADSTLDLIEKFNGVKDDGFNVPYLKTIKDSHETDMGSEVTESQSHSSSKSDQHVSNNENLIDASLSTWLSNSQLE